MQIIQCEEEQRRVWDDFVMDHGRSNIGHLFAWKKIVGKGLGHTTVYLMAKEGDEVKAVLPLAFVKTWWGARFYVSLPWIDYAGICADSEVAAEEIAGHAERLARRSGARFVEYRSIEPMIAGTPIRDDKVTFRLELDRDPEVIWKRFDAKLRNQIRKSEKSGLTVGIFGPERLDDFYRIFCWKMRDLGTPVWGKRFFASIFDELADSARIVLVFNQKMPIAGGLLLAFKDMLYVPSASSYNEFLKFCPNHALYWQVIKYGCENGYRYFDFGRSTWNSPTFNFKKQWVSPPIQLNWQYTLTRTEAIPAMNPDNPKYKTLISLWRRLPLWLTNFLGPKVIRNFP